MTKTIQGEFVKYDKDRYKDEHIELLKRYTVFDDQNYDFTILHIKSDKVFVVTLDKTAIYLRGCSLTYNPRIRDRLDIHDFGIVNFDGKSGDFYDHFECDEDEDD